MTPYKKTPYKKNKAWSNYYEKVTRDKKTGELTIEIINNLIYIKLWEGIRHIYPTKKFSKLSKLSHDGQELGGSYKYVCLREDLPC